MWRLAHLLAFLLATGAVPVTAATARLSGDLPRKSVNPIENTPGLETEYGVVQAANGTRLRTILTRPKGASDGLPAVFFIQEVSCQTIEFDGESRLRSMASRLGIVLIRVERAGTGDSEGQGCDALDYDTEVADYRSAFDQLASHAWVDPKRIVLYGSSLGSTIAPLVAQGKQIAGIVVQGGGAVTYLERMIGFDRLNLERSGQFQPNQVHHEMLRRVRFQMHYLLEKKTPEQVVAAYPDLAGVWESLKGTDTPPHYGRPYAWHWQAADKDFLGAWSRIEAPVMVVYGEYEQFEMRHGHRTIVDTVNALRPGTARWLEIPKAAHDLRIYSDPRSAYLLTGGERQTDLFLQPVIAWVHQITER